LAIIQSSDHAFLTAWRLVVRVYLCRLQVIETMTFATAMVKKIVSRFLR